MILRVMEDELEISRETIRKIFVEDLGKRKIWARVFPLRLQACQEFMQFVNGDRSLLRSVLMGDETCCSQHDPQTKKQST
jgi:hypothetical protein